MKGAMSLDAGAGDSGLVFARRQNLAGQAGEHYVLSRFGAPPGNRSRLFCDYAADLLWWSRYA